MVASTRNDDTGVFVAPSIAVAVWLHLCGSTPIIMLLALSQTIWDTAVGMPTSRPTNGGVTPLLSQTAAGR